MLLHCAANGLQAIDIVCIDYKDEAKVRQEALEGFHLGYAGHTLLHFGIFSVTDA